MIGLFAAGGWLHATPLFGGMDPVRGKPWYHAKMTWEAACAAGWTPGAATHDADRTSAAAALAWHVDYVDSYNYNPLWWATGGFDRFHVSLLHQHELEKLHFDDLTSTAQIRLVWSRYLAGTVAGLVWAAERQDVGAARNIVGSALHGLQDFYSHSNWVDEPSRREVTWQQAGPDLVPAGEDPREAMHLYTGAYETPSQHSVKPHGKYSLACSIMAKLPAPLMDALFAPISPLSNTALAQQWKACKEGKSVGIPKVLGVDVPKDLVYVEPPGMALDSPWLADIGVQVRDVDAATLQHPQKSPGEVLFEVAYARARDHTTQWLLALTEIMTAAGHGGFWTDVRTRPRQGEPTEILTPELTDLVTTYSEDRLQYEEPWRQPFLFASAGAYPPAPQGQDEGWYVRLEITTADDTLAGTDADIKVRFGEQVFLLDHMHKRTPDGGLGENRLLEWNDFEAGSRNTYVVGPLAERPTWMELINESGNIGQVLEAVWDGVVRWVEDTIQSLRDLGLALVGGHADIIGSDKVVLPWTDLVARRDQPTSTITLRARGGGEGDYEIRCLTSARQVGDGLRVGVAATRLRCHKESEWDRGSDSDEPFAVLLANSPAGGEIDSTVVGPVAAVNTGDVRNVGHGGRGHWWLGSFGPGGSPLKDIGDVGGFGDLTRSDVRIFPGDFTGDGREDLLFYCAGDGNWWLGSRGGDGDFSWHVASNTSGFGNLLRSNIRIYTGDFTGDGRTDVLFYCAGDGNWWLGRSDGHQLHWNVASSTTGFGSLLRSSVLIFTGRFTGDGRQGMLFYHSGDGNWWLGTVSGTQLAWGLANNDSKGFGSLITDRHRIWIGDLTGDGRDDVLFYSSKDGHWWLGRCDGARIGFSLANGDSKGFGNLLRSDIRIYLGDFTGDGKQDVLFYCGGDGNWWLGASDGHSIRFSLAGNTSGFGNLIAGGHQVFVGDFTGAGRDDVLFYFPGDGNWWLGTMSGVQLAWSHVGSAAVFGDLRRAGVRMLFGRFDGGRRRQLLLYLPMLTVTVPRHGGLIVPMQVWESDDESAGDRAKLERNFRLGFDPDEFEDRSALLDAVGRMVAADWKVGTVDAYAFLRGPVVHTAHLAKAVPLNRWVEGGASTRLQLSTASAVQVPVRVTTTPGAISSGETVLRGTWMLDLDTGAQGGPREHADLWWQQVDGTRRFLVGENGARLAALPAGSFDALTPQALVQAAPALERVDGSATPANQLTAGTLLAVRTGAGRVAKLLVTSYGYDLGLRWATYDAPPTPEPEPTPEPTPDPTPEPTPEPPAEPGPPPDKPDRPDRPGRPGRPDRPGKPDKPGKPGKPDPEPPSKGKGKPPR